MKTFEVGFRKSLWQYVTGVQAETEEEAIKIARGQLSESDWSDYGNHPEATDVSEE